MTHPISNYSIYMKGDIDEVLEAASKMQQTA